MQVRQVYILNLRGDQERLPRLRTYFETLDFIDVVRVEGTYGSGLPNDVCRRLTGDPYSIVAKGALGCALGHTRAWELIVAAQADWAIVIEDDVEVQHFELLRNWDMPEDVDLIFANDRTQPYPGVEHEAVKPILSPLKNSFRSIESRRKAVGTDCYIVNSRGAEKLLSLYSHHSYFGHVDMRMFAYSVDEDDLIESFTDQNWLVDGVRSIKRVTGAKGNLNTHVLRPPLSQHEASAETSRQREDRLGRPA